MPTVSERIETAVDDIAESSDVAQQFIDPSNTSEIVREEGNLKPLGLIQQEADAAINELQQETDSAIARIAHFKEETWMAGQEYTEKKIYFIHNGIAYNPVVIPYTAGLIDIQTDIDAGLFTVLQGLTRSDVGKEGVSLPSAKEAVVTYITLMPSADDDALSDASLEVGQVAKTRGYWGAFDGGFGTYDVEFGDTSNGYSRILLKNGNTAVLRKRATVFSHSYGVRENSGEDEWARLQFCIDDNKGAEIVLPAGVTHTTDWVHVPRGTELRGIGSTNAWSGRNTGSSLKSLGVGTPRIWTDVGDPGYAQWNTLIDTPITVMVVTEGDAKLRDISVVCNSEDPWDVGILNPACKRVGHFNVDTDGPFKVAGYYIDATWGVGNVALQTLHKDTYGREVLTDGGSNESYHQNCYYYGGKVGCMGKGTDRDPEDASSLSELVWSEGGASDLTFTSVRFGNYLDNAPDKLRHALYFDWGYARDVGNRDSKYFQNHYFYGCSVRADNWGRYSVLLDRSRFDVFCGLYGEGQQGYVTEFAQATVLIDTAQEVSPNPYQGLKGKTWKITLTDTVGHFDIRTTPWTVGATVTSASGGSFKIRSMGFDGVNRYFLANSVDGDVIAGDIITQAADQSVVSVYVANDRTQGLLVQGQGIFKTASNSFCQMGGNYMRTPRLEAAGMRLTESEWLLELAGYITHNLSGDYNVNCGDSIRFDARNTMELDGYSTTYLSCDLSQLNFYANAATTNDRLRWNGLSLSCYNEADVGSLERRFGTFFAKDAAINTSDEREKTPIRPLVDLEKACALELKNSIGVFQWNDAIELKGESGARLHVGVGAQTAKSIFESYGLDPFRYGMVCYDEWGDGFEEVKDREAGEFLNVQTAAAGNRYGVRYEQLICFILGAL